jgi:hypothetical protein
VPEAQLYLFCSDRCAHVDFDNPRSACMAMHSLNGTRALLSRRPAATRG